MIFAEVAADRAPTQRYEWPVCTAAGQRLGIITVEQWFDSNAVNQVILEWRRSGEVAARDVVVASRVWADDMIVDEWVDEGAAAVGAIAVPGFGRAFGLNARDAAARRFDRRGAAGQPQAMLFCNWDANGHAVRPINTDASPTFVMERPIEGVPSLVLCTIDDLTADEAADLVACEVHLIVRSRWGGAADATPEQKAAALDFIIKLFEHDEEVFRDAIAMRSADAKEDRARVRHGRRPRRRSPIVVPMYMLAGWTSTKPIDLPQRVASRALRLLGFTEDEIAAGLGAARKRIGRPASLQPISAQPDAGDPIAASQLRRELGSTRDFCGWLERALADVPRLRKAG